MAQQESEIIGIIDSVLYQPKKLTPFFDAAMLCNNTSKRYTFRFMGQYDVNGLSVGAKVKFVGVEVDDHKHPDMHLVLNPKYTILSDFQN